jgi:hypothetical protein
VIFGCLSDLLQFPKVNHSHEIISNFEFPKKKGSPICQRGPNRWPTHAQRARAHETHTHEAAYDDAADTTQAGPR